VELYRKVRLARSEGMSQRELARHFNISRDSVRKMLAFSSPPGYRRTKEIKRPKLDGFTEIIDGWLEGDKNVPRSATLRSGSTSGSRRSTSSLAAIRSSKTTFGSVNGAAVRCSCLWRIRRAMGRPILAKRSL
jgi:transcriptional regulator with XRE-family HTH domain